MGPAVSSSAAYLLTACSASSLRAIFRAACARVRITRPGCLTDIQVVCNIRAVGIDRRQPGAGLRRRAARKKRTRKGEGYVDPIDVAAWKRAHGDCAGSGLVYLGPPVPEDFRRLGAPPGASHAHQRQRSDLCAKRLGPRGGGDFYRAIHARRRPGSWPSSGSVDAPSRGGLKRQQNAKFQETNCRKW
jgi:hypothetical protein